MNKTLEEQSRSRFSDRLEQMFGFDLRSLALFRIALSLVVIVDLTIRSQDAEIFYSDSGVLPRTALGEIIQPWYWSLNSISGFSLVQFLLFLLAIFFALAMLVGYRTRLATIACWTMIISIHNRNLALIFAGDDVLRALLFWCMFLPLGACYSIDSALNKSNQPLPKRIISVATVALILQQCYIYMGSVAFKHQSPLWWPQGEAVYYALNFDQYATEVGKFLASQTWLLQSLTYQAYFFELLGPLIIFIPFRNDFFRGLAVVLFIILHFSFGLCFTLGIFPFLSIASWLAYIPSSFWDSWLKRLKNPERQGLQLYYDAECGFCKKMVHFIRTFFILPGTPLLMAQEETEIFADMQANNSWVVVDWQGKRRFKWDGFLYVMSLSPVLKYLEPILRAPFLMSLGTKIYETIASNRRVAGKFTAPFKYTSFEIKTAWWLNIITFLLLVLTSIWNLKSFADQTVSRRTERKNDWINSTHQLLTRKTFQTIAPLARLTRLDQSWSIFAPNPPRDDGWQVIIGKTEDGKEVNLLKATEEINWNKPTIQQRDALYKNMQWRSYFINLNRAIGQKLQPLYVRYLCRNWNVKNGSQKRLQKVSIYFMDERTVPQGETQTVKKTQTWEESCPEE
jgi:hypothetical protein